MLGCGVLFAKVTINTVASCISAIHRGHAISFIFLSSITSGAFLTPYLSLFPSAVSTTLIYIYDYY